MRLIHASIPADDPASVARTLSEIMGGEALPFPPGGPDAWLAWAGDGKSNLEVIKRGKLVHLDEEQGEWRFDGTEPQRLTEVHLAIGVERPEHEIVEIARATGWTARHCSRGNGIFDLVEVWVEDSFMIEFFDPRQAAHYDRTISFEAWKGFLAHMEAAA